MFILFMLREVGREFLLVFYLAATFRCNTYSLIIVDQKTGVIFEVGCVVRFTDISNSV